MARWLRSLAAALRSIKVNEVRELPLLARDGYNRLSHVLSEAVARWGWDNVIGDGGEEFLQGRLVQFDAEITLPWLQYVLSYVDARIRRGEAWEGPGVDSHTVQRAEKRGLKPEEFTDPDDEAINKIYKLYCRQFYDPLIGSQPADFTSEEIDVINASADKLREAISAMLPSLAGIEPVNGAIPPTREPETKRDGVSVDGRAIAGTATKLPPGPTEQAHDLTNPEHHILKAAVQLKAVKCDKAQIKKQLAKKAGVGSPDNGNVRAAFGNLLRLGFLKSKSGPGGGCWITDKGLAALES
jgi:hypothetical protein